MRFRCLQCRKRINVEVLEARRRVICPRCDTKYWIPGQAEVDAGAVAEPASPIKRRPTPLVDLLPRPRLFARKPKQEPRETQLPSEPKPPIQAEISRAKLEIESKTTPKSATWKGSLSPVGDRDPAANQSKLELPRVVLASSKASVLMTLVALVAVLLTTAYLMNRVLSEPDEVPNNNDRIVVMPAKDMATPKAPIEFAELLHRDATRDVPVEERAEDGF